MTTSVQRLKQITRRLLDSQPLDESAARWLGTALDSYLGRRCRSLDEALGLRLPRGGVPWWLEEALRERDRALRELAERFFSSERITAQAARIRTLALRYAATAWRRDRERSDAPAHYAGTPHFYLWQAFKSGAPMPIGERHLRNILRA